MTFIDTHAHLDFPDFAADLPDILARAEKAGVDRIITIGTTLESSQRAVEIAENHPHVYAAVGWHPSYVTSAPENLPGAFADLLRHPKVVAIGEAGLDHSRLPSKNGGTPADDDAYKARQKSLFQQQLEWARETGLNIVVHQRECFAETLEVLRPFTAKVRAVFHCFVGTPSEAAQIRALGSLVSFTGIATFKNATVIRETLAATPLGEFMLETDCPFLAPVPHRGKRCEPAFVADLASFVAREKNCTMDELSAATNRAAESFFQKLTRA